MSFIEKIDTICLKVSDIEKSCKWYEDVLGLKEAFSGEGYRIFSVGESEIPLTLEESCENNDSPQKGVYPIFFTRDIEDAYNQLKEQSVKVSEIQHDGTNTFFDFYDLDQNRLQICFWE
ncbi:VOC family protein [Virgibacillus doumboii]|uniref:VOC family protein n=1 Tax=Virgibacillus doumboii TaxID=2697503 RepID=UPI0013DEC075|nr:VOC family protein [Virgibacillus doumboii]